MARLTFGVADPRTYRLASNAELNAGGAIVQLCHPDPVNPYPVLTATESRGIPCHRCIANTAAPGDPAACSFLVGRLTVARRAEPPAPAGGLFAPPTRGAFDDD